MLAATTMAVTLQYVNRSNQLLVHFKLTQYYVNYMSIKLVCIIVATQTLALFINISRHLETQGIILGQYASGSVGHQVRLRPTEPSAPKNTHGR